jgi:phospholipase/carboxylesterase
MTDHGVRLTRPSESARAVPAHGRYPIAVPGGREALLVVPAALGPGRAPVLVFCHGAGGSPAGAVPLVEQAAADAGALLVLPPSAGRTWDLVRGAPGPDTVAVQALLRQVTARFAVDLDRLAIGGFSDGGSYALSLGLANGDVFGAVLAFSPGFVAAPRRTGRPRVFISHGTTDQVLPVERCGRRVASQLRDAGYPVTYQEFPDGHVVPPATAAAAFRWWLDAPEKAGPAC